MPTLASSASARATASALRQLQHMDRRLDDVLQHGHVRPQVEALEHHAELGADAVDLLVVFRRGVAIARGLHLDELAGDEDAAGIGRLQEVDAAEHGALAGAAAAEDGDDIALVGLERDALEHFEVAEALVHVLDDEGRRGIRHSSVPCLLRRGYDCRLVPITIGRGRGRCQAQSGGGNGAKDPMPSGNANQRDSPRSQPIKRRSRCLGARVQPRNSQFNPMDFAYTDGG